MKLFDKHTWAKMSPLKKRLLKAVIGGITGGAIGLLYYIFIGCNSGSCAITSNPYISTAYGMVFGILIGVL